MNYKNLWTNFGAKQFANSIATKAPKFKFSNSIIQAEWEVIEKYNNLLNINYKIINNSSIYGNHFLGLKVIENIPILITGEVIEYEMIANKIIKLDIKIDLFKNWNICEFYDLHDAKWKNQVQRYAFNSKNEFKSLKTIKYSGKEQEFLITKNIPYWPFFANPLESADFENVPNELLEDWYTHLILITTDSLISKGLTHLNTPQMTGTADNIKKLKEALLDPKAVVYENTNIFSMLQQGGVQIQQGVSNYSSILEKIKFLENKIKQLAFLKKETTDLGTKNLQTSETELLNSDSDDYIELKANLMEIQWQGFLRNVFFDYLETYKKIDCFNCEIDVEVIGSTKFLQNRSNRYIQNQQGSLMNPNEINNQTIVGEQNE